MTLIEAVGIVIVVIFLFLASFRSVIIPVVTIPLSLIGVCSLMLVMGFSINLLTLLAMVLAIGLVVDDAIVVVENIHRHLEEGKSPVQASLKGAREIVGPVISMTITLAAVYAPIGFLGGLTGALFREFAFTLAGSVIVSGVIALTLSPMMCSVLLKQDRAGWFAQKVDKVFGATTRWYGRQLDRSLDYRPITGDVRGRDPRPRRVPVSEHAEGAGARGGSGHSVRGREGAEIRQYRLRRFLRRARWTRRSRHFPETDLRFVINGIDGPSNGIAGMLLKPWDERERSSTKLKPLVQAELSKIEGVNAFAFNLPPLPGGPGGLPIQMVINSTNGFQSIYEEMVKLKDAARKSGLFIVADSDLDFNQPVVRVKIDRSKANDLGITMAQIGSTLATLLGGNYTNRFNLEGRSYQVIPQVPRGERLSPESLANYYVPTTTGQQVPLSTLVSIETATDPERADALQPAQRRDLPGGADAGRHGRAGGRLPGEAGQATCRPASATTISRTPGSMCRRAISSPSPSASR